MNSGEKLIEEAKQFFDNNYYFEGIARILVADNNILEEYGDSDPIQWCYEQAKEDLWVYDNSIVYWF
mgnify:CR=1 FL=1